MAKAVVLDETEHVAVIDGFDIQPTKEIKFDVFIRDINIIARLEKDGMLVMKEVQYKAYDKVFNGFNVMIQSNTGSGKTLAYLLPLIMSERRGLIIVPTYELATQTYDIAKAFTSRIGINAGQLCIDLRADIVICTLGKCREMYMDDRVFCCIDEADRILENEVFLNGCFEQFVLVSATMDSKSILKRLIRKCSKSMKIRTKTKNNIDRIIDIDSSTDTKRILTKNNEEIIFYRINIIGEQIVKEFYINVEYSYKLFIFIEFLRKNRSKKMIVFFNTINSVVFYYNLLKRMNFSVIAIFGRLNQRKRKEIMEKYETVGGVLLCTDLMSRGFDFKSVDLVVHFEPSFTLNNYVHRKGRAGRNRRGKSILFLSNAESGFISEVTNIKEVMYLKKKFVVCDQTSHEMVIKAVSSPQNTYSGFLTHKIYEMVKNDVILHKMAVDALKSFLRIYEGNTGEYFNVNSLDLNDITRTFGMKKMPRIDFV
ncbi:ATP-dependent RNA helicase pitchoune [Trachipleistophora hominis]|uniref:ATP-dependent RNA helicase n=1 Tax=Trachipleistophora hominis TaxID=72359 RepID=L7JSS7_TRAHO|nr:ATP-dependent RNA helicase pitchoune [Trachipleistophora hominis]